MTYPQLIENRKLTPPFRVVQAIGNAWFIEDSNKVNCVIWDFTGRQMTESLDMANAARDEFNDAALRSRRAAVAFEVEYPRARRRREAAVAIAAGLARGGERFTASELAEHAVVRADAVLAELERTA